MKIQVHWGKPIPLTFKKVKLKGGKTQMDALKHAVKRDVEDCLGDGYGVYVFARRHGDNYYAPLYAPQRKDSAKDLSHRQARSCDLYP